MELASGPVVGCYGDLVILQASDAIEAIRLNATRLPVIGRKPVIATTPRRKTHLQIDGRPAQIEASTVRSGLTLPDHV